MADTKRQEQASLVTFYYAIEKGANLGTLQEPAIGAVDRDEDLYNAIKDVYPMHLIRIVDGIKLL